MKKAKFKIFLSHIHEDKDLAGSLKHELERLYLGAIEIFVSSDDADIRGGDKWLEVIVERLKAAELILVLATTESISRPWINFEAGGGLFLDKRVIPLCAFAENEPINLPEPLRRLHQRNLRERHDIKRLLYDISSNAGLMVPDEGLEDLYDRLWASARQSTVVGKEMPTQINRSALTDTGERRGLVEATQAAKDLLTVITKLVPAVNRSIKKVNDEMTRFNSARSGARQNKSASLIASHLRNGAKEIEQTLPKLNEGIDVFIEFLSGYTSVHDSNRQEDREQLSLSREQISGILGSITPVLESMRIRRSNALGLGILSAAVGNASQQMGQALQGIISSFERLEAFCKGAIELIDSRISAAVPSGPAT